MSCPAMCKMRSALFFLGMVCICLGMLGRVSGNKAFDATGQIPQVSYARKATRGGKVRCVGISCSDGAVMVSAVRNNHIGISCPDRAVMVSAVRNNHPSNSPSTVPGDSKDSEGSVDVSRMSLVQETRILSAHSKQLFRIDGAMTSALTGISSDCHHLLRVMRKEAMEYRTNFGETIPIQSLADRVSSYLHGLTLSSDTRPLAVSVILCSRSSRQLDTEGDTDGRTAGGDVISITCDGGYEHCLCWSLETESGEDDAALTRELRTVQWSSLTVEGALRALRVILDTLEVEDEDERRESREKDSDDDSNGRKGGVEAKGKGQSDVSKGQGDVAMVPKRMVAHPYSVLEIMRSMR